MPADPKWLESWMAENGPYLYHVTNTRPGVVARILSEGIVPWDKGPGALGGHATRHTEPRPGHVYLATLDVLADLRGSDLAWWLPRTIAVNLLALDPAHLNPDEDAFINALSDSTSPSAKSLEIDNPDIAALHARHYRSYGEWAEDFRLGSCPEHTHLSLERNGTIAYRGVIHPSALSPAEDSPELVSGLTVLCAA